MRLWPVNVPRGLSWIRSLYIVVALALSLLDLPIVSILPLTLLNIFDPVTFKKKSKQPNGIGALAKNPHFQVGSLEFNSHSSKGPPPVVLPGVYR